MKLKTNICKPSILMGKVSGHSGVTIMIHVKEVTVKSG